MSNSKLQRGNISICWYCKRCLYWDGCMWVHSHTIPKGNKYVTSDNEEVQTAIENTHLNLTTKLRVCMLSCSQFLSENYYDALQKRELFYQIKSDIKSSKDVSSRSSVKRGNAKKGQEVLKVDLLYNKVVDKYSGLFEAAYTMNVNIKSLQRCLKDKGKSCKDYRWCYVDGKTNPLKILTYFDDDGRELQRFKNLSEASKYFHVSLPTMKKMVEDDDHFRYMEIIFDDSDKQNFGTEVILK